MQMKEEREAIIKGGNFESYSCAFSLLSNCSLPNFSSLQMGMLSHVLGKASVKHINILEIILSLHSLLGEVLHT